MKRILFPTDFSTTATRSFRYILEFAKSIKAEVDVLHVLFPNEGIDQSIYNTYWAQDYMDQREKALDVWVRTHARKVGLSIEKIHQHCTIGFPVSAICDLANELDVDMIAMGTTGATGLRGTVLGSVAAGVLEKSDKPILAIPRNVSFPMEGCPVYATDFRFNCSDETLSIMKTLIQKQDKPLQVVHIIDKPGTKPDTSREKSLVDKLGVKKAEFHYLHDQDIPQAISNFIEAVDAGLLIAVAHEHGLIYRIFHESVTRKLAYRTNIPFLVFHEPE